MAQDWVAADTTFLLSFFGHVKGTDRGPLKRSRSRAYYENNDDNNGGAAKERDGMMVEFSAGLRKACLHQSTHVRACLSKSSKLPGKAKASNKEAVFYLHCSCSSLNALF